MEDLTRENCKTRKSVVGARKKVRERERERMERKGKENETLILEVVRRERNVNFLGFSFFLFYYFSIFFRVVSDRGSSNFG